MEPVIVESKRLCLGLSILLLLCRPRPLPSSTSSCPCVATLRETKSRTLPFVATGRSRGVHEPHTSGTIECATRCGGVGGETSMLARAAAGRSRSAVRAGPLVVAALVVALARVDALFDKMNVSIALVRACPWHLPLGAGAGVGGRRASPRERSAAPPHFPLHVSVAHRSCRRGTARCSRGTSRTWTRSSPGTT